MKTGKGFLIAPALAASLCLPAAPASAQALSISPEGWTRLEARENADFDAAGPNDPHDDLSRLRLNLTWKSRPEWSAFVQPQYAYRRVHGAPGANTRQDEMAIHQGYVDLTAAGGRLRLGRQEMAFGDARLLGAGNWTHTGRSFDAVRLTRALPSAKTTLDLFAGKLGHVANKTNNPTLAGLYATRTVSTAAATDLYLLYKGDRASGRSQEVWTPGVRSRLAWGRGFDATAEAAYQLGHLAGRDVSAWAYSAAAGYTVPGPLGLRLGLEHDFASGSADPTGAGTAGTGDFHTFDHLFPTNHFHYGTMDLVGWRNMAAWRASLRARPAARWTVVLDGWRFRLANARDFWYGDNGRPVRGADGQPLRDPSGTAGRDLGSELDLTLTYVNGKHISISGGYSRFWPGDFVRRTNSGASAGASDWLYLQTNYTP